MCGPGIGGGEGVRSENGEVGGENGATVTLIDGIVVRDVVH